LPLQAGRFRVWCVCPPAAASAPGSGAGATCAGPSTSSGVGGAPGAPAPRTLLIRVDDYAPSIYLPAPLVKGPDPQDAGREPADADLARLQHVLNARCADCWHCGQQHLGWGGPVAVRQGDERCLWKRGAAGIAAPLAAQAPFSPLAAGPSPFFPSTLRPPPRLASDCRIGKAALVTARPIMYYRPAAPGGQPYVKFTLRPGGSFKKAAGGWADGWERGWDINAAAGFW
jgi:hypothetical protein